MDQLKELHHIARVWVGLQVVMMSLEIEPRDRRTGTHHEVFRIYSFILLLLAPVEHIYMTIIVTHDHYCN